MIAGIVLVILGVVLALQEEVEEKTVSVVPVPKKEVVKSLPYLIPGIAMVAVGAVISAFGVYKLITKNK
jgi:uncharacterized membrane protein